MEGRAAQVTRPAIVLDIDETSLSNWPAYRVNGWVRITNGPCDLKVGPCGLRAWQATAASKALVPTLELAKRAETLGVAVFFITGRPANLREATDRNLRQEGYQPAGVILEPEGATFKSAVDFKAPERRKIIERGIRSVPEHGRSGQRPARRLRRENLQAAQPGVLHSIGMRSRTGDSHAERINGGRSDGACAARRLTWSDACTVPTFIDASYFRRGLLQR